MDGDLVTGVPGKVAAETLKGLVGAYRCEVGGDFYSVVRLWSWLCKAACMQDGLEVAPALHFLG